MINYMIDKNVRVNFRISESSIKYLDMYAANKNMTRSEAIRDIVNSYLIKRFPSYLKYLRDFYNSKL